MKRFLVLLLVFSAATASAAPSTVDPQGTQMLLVQNGGSLVSVDTGTLKTDGDRVQGVTLYEENRLSLYFLTTVTGCRAGQGQVIEYRWLMNEWSNDPDGHFWRASGTRGIDAIARAMCKLGGKIAGEASKIEPPEPQIAPRAEPLPVPRAEPSAPTPLAAPVPPGPARPSAGAAPANPTALPTPPKLKRGDENAAILRFQQDMVRIVGTVVSERDYPRLARDRGWEGSTMVRVEIGPDGLLKAVTVTKSSGFSVLDDRAVSKIREIRLPNVPDELRERAFSVDVPIKFSLHNREQ